jgi:hypothetical protein
LTKAFSLTPRDTDVPGALRDPEAGRFADDQSKTLKRRFDMYATVRRYEGVTDPSEAGRRVNEGFVPLISQVPGFVAYYWVNAGGGVMISTSVFQDQSGAEESNKRAADYVRENLASLLPKPPQITAGEVVAHKAK